MPKLMHCYPEGDLREHVTDGSPCPCMAQEREKGSGVVIHNSYDTREVPAVAGAALAVLLNALHNRRDLHEDEALVVDHALQLIDMHKPPEDDQ